MRKFTDPISNDSQDLFQRSRFVEHLLRTLVKSGQKTETTGNVVSIEGAWGSGKSSVLNLLKEKLHLEEEILTVNFVPWMAGPDSNLVEFFFSILISKLQPEFVDRDNIIEDLKIYSGIASSGLDILSSLTGQPWNLANHFLRRRFKSNPNPVEIRDRINAFINRRQLNFVIIIDEIDRLTSREIQEVFRLVRAVADFDRFSYILAFDREVVEQALRQNGHVDANYLEKIINLELYLPVPLPSESSALMDNILGRNSDQLDHFGLDLNDPRYMDLQELVSTHDASAREGSRAVSSLLVYLDAIDMDAYWVDILALIFLKHRDRKLFSIIQRSPDMFVSNPVSAESITLLYGKESARLDKLRAIIDRDNLDAFSLSLFDFIFPSLFHQDKSSKRKDSLQFRTPLFTVLRFGQVIKTIDLRSLRYIAESNNKNELTKLWVKLFRKQDGDGIEQAFDYMRRHCDHENIWRSVFSAFKIYIDEYSQPPTQLRGLLDLVSQELFRSQEIPGKNLASLLSEHRSSGWQLTTEILRKNVFFAGIGRWADRASPERIILDADQTEREVIKLLDFLLEGDGIASALKGAIDSNFIWLFHDLNTEHSRRFAVKIQPLLEDPNLLGKLVTLLFGPGYSTDQDSVSFFTSSEKIISQVRSFKLETSKDENVRTSAKILMERWTRDRRSYE